MPDTPEDPPVSSAADRPVTLDQALLAPLDAIFTAQLHAARSFLNMLLQLGFPHRHTEKKEGRPVQSDEGKDGEAYALEFFQEVEEDGVTQRKKISVPALSLVPVSPLAVDSAEFNLELTVHGIKERKQMRESAKADERESRPWYLVDKPINIEGVFAPPSSETKNGGERLERQSAIKINVKVSAVPMPAGLNKLLTALTETSRVEDVPPRGEAPTTAGETPPQPDADA